LPVIIVTADPFTDTLDDARARGAFDCIVKPFEAADVRRVLAAALRAREADGPR